MVLLGPDTMENRGKFRTVPHRYIIVVRHDDMIEQLYINHAQLPAEREGGIDVLAGRQRMAVRMVMRHDNRCGIPAQRLLERQAGC